MMDGEIKLGDILRIREWDDMVNEFGTKYGGIRVSQYTGFSSVMKYLCGSKFTVAEIFPDSEYDTVYYRSAEGVENDRGFGEHWYITAGMLEPYDRKDDMEPADTDGLFSFLGM